MLRTPILLALSTAAAAQTVPPLPSLDAARAAARQVDQVTQVPRTGKEAMDRVAPLVTVEPGDEAAWRKEKKQALKKAIEAAKPQ